jgi:hypothetical protein
MYKSMTLVLSAATAKIPAALTNARRMLIGDENRRLSTRGALYGRTWSQAVRENSHFESR